MASGFSFLLLAATVADFLYLPRCWNDSVSIGLETRGTLLVAMASSPAGLLLENVAVDSVVHMVATEVEEVAEVAVEATIVALEEEGVVLVEQVVAE